MHWNILYPKILYIYIINIYIYHIMLSNSVTQKVYNILILTVLTLSIIALIAEFLPEVKAKMIVIPTLILIIILCLLETRRLFFNKSINF